MPGMTREERLEALRRKPHKEQSKKELKEFDKLIHEQRQAEYVYLPKVDKLGKDR